MEKLKSPISPSSATGTVLPSRNAKPGQTRGRLAIGAPYVPGSRGGARSHVSGLVPRARV